MFPGVSLGKKINESSGAGMDFLLAGKLKGIFKRC